MADEPDNLVLELLRGIRADMATKTGLMELKSEILTEVTADMNTLRTDVASDMIVTRNEIGEQIVGLRRAVMEYHSSVIGHGIIISELEARVRRMELHLNLPAMGAP